MRPWFAYNPNLCSRRGIWSGEACLRQTSFVDACSGLRAALARQAQRMQAAESARQDACARNAMQECSELNGEAQSEASFYRALQEKLRQCELAHPYGGYGFGSYSQGLTDPQQIDLNHQ